MSDIATRTETPMAGRDALDTLACMPLDELRRLAARLDEETRIIRSLLRQRTRRPRELATAEDGR